MDDLNFEKQIKLNSLNSLNSLKCFVLHFQFSSNNNCDWYAYFGFTVNIILHIYNTCYVCCDYHHANWSDMNWIVYTLHCNWTLPVGLDYLYSLDFVLLLHLQVRIYAIIILIWMIWMMIIEFLQCSLNCKEIVIILGRVIEFFNENICE